MSRTDKRWDIVGADGSQLGIVVAMTKEQAERACLYEAIGADVATSARVALKGNARLSGGFELKPRRPEED